MFEAIKSMLRKKAAEVPAAEIRQGDYIAKDAGFRISYDADRVALFLEKQTEPLFVASGLVFVHPNIVHTERGGTPAVIYKFGPEFSVTYIPPANIPVFSENLSIQKAIYRKIPNSRQGLDVQVMYGMEKIRYLVDLSPCCTVKDFNEIDNTDVNFTTVPPITQMVAFLRATLHQRRTVVRSLLGLSRHCSDSEIHLVVNYMLEKFSNSEDFLHFNVLKLRDRLSQSGRSINLNSLIAMCVTSDVYLRRITISVVDECSAGGTVIPVSADSCEAVGVFLGGEGFSADSEDSRRALDFLRSTVSGRSFRTILCDIAEDGGSKVSLSAVRKLMEIVPENETFFDSERGALCQFLEAYGKKVNPDVVSALCLYADLEAHIVREDQIDQFLPEVYLSEHSLYSTLAVGCAFGLELRCLSITGDTPEEILVDFCKLINLTGRGAIARFVEPEVYKTKTFYVRDIDALQQICSEGYTFTGETILSLPIIDHVDSHELAVFLQKGMPVLSCFLPEDRCPRWSLINPGSINSVPASVVGRYGFIDGYKAYRFYNRVIGRFVPCTAEQLVGRTNVVAVYKNSRGMRSYRFLPVVSSPESVLRSHDSEVVFAEEIAEFPRFKSLTSRVCEERSEVLSGVVDIETPECLALVNCLNGIRVSLLSESAQISLREHPSVLEKLREVLRSPGFRASTMEVLDYASRCKLVAIIGEKGHPLRGDIKIVSALLSAFNSPQACEVAAMFVIYAMCEDNDGQFSDYKIIWAPDLFRSLIQERLFAMVRSESVPLRILGCLLLSNTMFAASKDCYDSTIYVLSCLLSDSSVGLVAAMALARISLVSTLPLIPAVSFGRWVRVDVESEAETEAMEDMTAQIKNWLDTPSDNEDNHSLEIPARANIKGEELKIKLLSLYVSKLNTSFRHERCLKVSRRYLILPPEAEDVKRQKIMAAWRSFFAFKGLSANGEDYGSHLYGEFWRYLPEYESMSKNDVLVRDAEIYEMNSWYQILPGPDSLFLKLSSMIPPPESGELASSAVPAVCRCPEEAATGGALDLGCCEIFSRRSNRWVPFMDRSFGAYLGLGASERVLYDNLGTIYTRVMGFETGEAADESSESRSPSGMICSGEASPVRPEQVCRPCQTMGELAEHVAESFRISVDLWRQVNNILLGLASTSKYKLPPYAE